MQTSEEIEQAIDVIQAYGWRRSYYGRGKNPRCIVGSFREGGYFPSRYWRALTSDFFPHIEVLFWNDKEAEDRHEVVAMLLSMLNLALKDENENL